MCDDSSDATHDLPPAQNYTPTNLSNKFSESTTTITTNTATEQHGENLASPTRQELSRTASEDEEDLSDSRQTGVSSADNSFASAARGLGECETNHNMCSQGRCCCCSALKNFGSQVIHNMYNSRDKCQCKCKRTEYLGITYIDIFSK